MANNDEYQGRYTGAILDQTVDDVTQLKTNVSGIDTRVQTLEGETHFSPTEPQLTAMNSGIDSTKVAQIALISDKQDALTTAQMAAVNSGVTSETVASIAGKQDALTTAQMAAVNSGATAEVIASIADKQDALTTAQMAAVNSGATSEIIASISGKQAALSSAQMTAVNSGINATKVSQIAANTSAIDSKADKTTTTSLQAQIDAIVTPVTQDAEVENARVDSNGKTYTSLKTRLDTENAALVNSVAEQTAIVDEILENPVLYKRTVTHPAGWSPKTVIFGGLNLKSGNSYAITIESDAALPSTYLYFSQANGTDISNRSLLGKTRDKWVINPNQDYTNCTIRIASGSEVTVLATFGANKDTNVIDDMRTHGELKVAKSIEPRSGARALITIIDDDGKSEFYDIYKPMLQDGYKITCGIDPVNWTGVDNSFMTWEQVMELKALGCEFVIHGAYPWLFPKQTQSEGYASADVLRAYFRAAQDEFKYRGLDGWNIGVYPQSNQNHDTRLVVKDYFSCVFGGTPPTGESVINTSPITTYRIYRMSGIGHSDGSDEYDLQVYKDAIDEAAAKKGWLVILNHSQYGWNDARKQKLRDILDYARTQGVTNVTTARGFDLFRNMLELGDFANKGTNENRKATIVGTDGTTYMFPPTFNGKTLVFNQDGSVSWANA